MLGTPVSKFIPQYSAAMTFKGSNHYLKEYNFPNLIVLNVGY